MARGRARTSKLPGAARIRGREGRTIPSVSGRHRDVTAEHVGDVDPRAVLLALPDVEELAAVDRVPRSGDGHVVAADRIDAIAGPDDRVVDDREIGEGRELAQESADSGLAPDRGGGGGGEGR